MTVSLFNVARRYAAIGILAICSSYGSSAFAQSQNPTVVMDSTNFLFYSAYQVTDTQWRGPAFTSGPVPTRIAEIILGIVPNGPSRAVVLRLFQLDDTTALPSGSALATTSLVVVDNTDNNTNLSPNTYTAAQLGPISAATLLPNKKYALILSGTSNLAFGLNDNDSPGNAYSYAGGFSVAAGGYLQTYDSGANWQQNNSVTPGFRLTVVPVDQAITPTPVPALGVFGLVTLTSAIAFLGIRRSRRST